MHLPFYPAFLLIGFHSAETPVMIYNRRLFSWSKGNLLNKRWYSYICEDLKKKKRVKIMSIPWYRKNSPRRIAKYKTNKKHI